MKKRRVKAKIVKIKGKTYLPIITKLIIGKCYGCTSAILKINNKSVGQVNLQKPYVGYGYNSRGQWVKNTAAGLPNYETHSDLDETWHGFGFGIAMYDKAIEYALKNKKTIGSSCGPSSDAKRVWRSRTLRKKYRIKYDKKIKRFIVRGLKRTKKHRPIAKR